MGIASRQKFWKNVSWETFFGNNVAILYVKKPAPLEWAGGLDYNIASNVKFPTIPTNSQNR